MLRRIFLAAGLAVLTWLVVRLGAGRIGSMLLELGWVFPAITLLYAGHQLARTAALRRCLPPGVRFAYRDLLPIRVAGEAITFLTFTGPFLAEPTKALLLKRRGLSAEQAFAAGLAEYLVYMLLSASLSLAALVFLLVRFDLSGAVRAGIIAASAALAVFLAVALLAIVFRIHLIGAALGRLTMMPAFRDRWHLDPARVTRMEVLLLELLRDSPGRLLGIIAIDLVAQAVLVVELFWMMRTLALVFPPAYAVLIEAASKCANFTFFFVPGRVGAAEGAFALIFAVIGLPAAAGFTVSFARRLRSLLVAGLGGLALWSLTTNR